MREYDYSAYTAGGYVPVKVSSRMNLQAFSDSLNKIDARHKEALAQRNQIMAALGQLDLNEAEDEFKVNYIQNIQNQIDAESQFGGYSTALTKATQLAGDVLSDPQILGRVRAQQQYKKALETVQARNDISQTTKDRWIEQNPYNYQDKYDSKGNVIGGTGFKANWTPVSKIDLTDIYAKVKAFVAEKSGTTHSVTFVDENGKPTNDISKGFYGMLENVNGTWVEVSEDRLKNAFDAIFKSTPGAMEAIMQDRDDRIWEYNKADEEGKKAFIGSDIMDNSGIILSPEEYLNKKVNPVLHEMSYRNTSSNYTYGDGYSNYLKDQKAKQLANGIAQQFAGEAQAITQGEMIKLDYSKTIGDSYNAAKGAIDDIKKYFPRFTADPSIQKLINSGNYNQLISRLIEVADPKNANYIPAMQAINTLETYSDIYSKYTANMNDAQKDAINFTASLSSGSVPTGKGNFTRSYVNSVNSLFADGKPIVFLTQDDKQYDKIVYNLGGNNNLSQYGLKQYTANGKKGFIVDKQSNLIKLKEALVDDRFWSFSRSNFYNLNSDGTVGNIIRVPEKAGDVAYSGRMITGKDILNSMYMTYERAAKDSKDALTNVGANIESIQNLPANPGAAGEYQYVQELVKQGYFKDAKDAKETLKEFDDQFASEARATWLTNYDVYAREEGSNSPLELVDNDKAAELTQSLWDAIDNNAATPVFTPDPMGVGSGGTTWHIASYKNKDGKVVPMQNIYVRGMFSGAHQRYIANHPERKAVITYQNARNTGTDIHLFGTCRITNVTNDGGMLNMPNGASIKLSPEGCINSSLVANTYKNVVKGLQDARKNGVKASSTDIKNAADTMTTQLGFKPNTTDFDRMSGYIASQLSKINK